MVHRVGGKGASHTKASSTKEASTNTKSERFLREPWHALVLASSVGKVCAPWCSVAWCLLVVIVSLLGMTLSFCEQWSPCNRWSSFQTCEFPKTWSENCMQNTVSRRSWNRLGVDFNPKGRGQKKNGIMWEKFPSGRHPPGWDTPVIKKNVGFIFHFRTSGTFLVFTKKSQFLGGKCGWC